ncbi:MAG: Bug family tripartite tricarboxylate transporter substrate binding protein [Hydrogenophaga sp.]|nr:Bug family tripartite tricarboxylate transporter substrate binding protein [Hydrogenophaga sp.]
MQRRHLITLATAALLATSSPAHAQSTTLRVWVGFPPGGSVDTVARLVAEKIKATLNQNVIVENKPGAGGRVVLGELKRAAPDGNTIVLAPSGALVIAPWLYDNLGYDPIRDFTPIARATVFDFAVTAGPGAPAGKLRAVLDWMKADPTRANYATSGAGTVPHFAGLLIGQAAGVPLTHVPYRGGAPAAQDLLGGQIPLMVDTASETIEHHRAGRLRILAVTGEQRSAALPDVPTLREQGIPMAADAFFAYLGPAGLNAPVAERISHAVAQALADPGIQERIRGFGLVPSHAGPAATATTVAEHLKRWEAPVKASGFKPE